MARKFTDPEHPHTKNTKTLSSYSRLTLPQCALLSRGTKSESDPTLFFNWRLWMNMFVKKSLKFLGDQCLEASHQILCRSLKIAESHCIVPYNDGSLWEGYGKCFPSHREAHIQKHFTSPVIWLFQPVFHFQRNL